MGRIRGVLLIGFILYCAWSFDPELTTEMGLGLGVVACGILLALSLAALKHNTGPINLFALVGLAIAVGMLLLVRDGSFLDMLSALCLTGVFGVCAAASYRTGDADAAADTTAPWRPAGPPAGAFRPAGSSGWGGPGGAADATAWTRGGSGDAGRGAGERGAPVVLRLDGTNQYAARGAINGLPVTFYVDTGASEVVVSPDVAKRLRLRPRGWSVTTAVIGDVRVQNVLLDEVVLGSIRVRNVSGHVAPEMPPGTALLGNSFLRHVRLESGGGTLTLRPLR